MRNETWSKFCTKVGHAKGKYHISIFGIIRMKYECGKVTGELEE